MAASKKTRKTKKEKVRSQERRVGAAGFKVKEEWLSVSLKKIDDGFQMEKTEKKYFRADLTKTLILTMLVLALELALWNYFSRH